MLNIYKASAGAGKTYTLTLHYIQLLFKNPKNYRKTLAVTFTNNACGEMKNRILHALYELSYNPNANYIKELQSDGFSLDEIQEKASRLYKEILHNYSFFYIETIDAFTQKVIRSFAKDLGLPPKFTVEIKNEEILENLVKNLLIHSIDNEELHQTIVDFAFSDIEENKTTNLKREILNESKIFFSEQYQDCINDSEDQQTRIQNLRNLFHAMEEHISQYTETVTELAGKALQMIQHAGLQLDADFKGASRGKMLLLRPLHEKNFQKGLPSDVCEAETIAQSKKVPQVKDLYASEFQQIMCDLYALAGSDSVQRKTILTEQKIVAHKQGIILSQYILNELDTYSKEESTFFIGFANKFLKTIINGSDTPFVYEKIGQTIENIMIDEFQDTSKMQWENFKPIISNLLGSSNDALIIGDVKQSIYRFRNGDWKLLHYLHEDKDFDSQIHTILDNHRSLRNIVQFNNTFFEAYADYVENKFNNENGTQLETIRDIYSDCKQGIVKGDGGCVEITIVNGNKEVADAETEGLLLESIFDKVLKLLESGRKPDDIVFLCYRNDDIGELVSFFNEKKKNPEYEAYKEAFSIVNKEALLLSKAPSIQFITTYLQKLIEPEGSSSESYFNELLSFLYKEITQSEELPIVTIPRNMSLFETCESIIQEFHLANETEIPFIADFQDIIFTYSKNNNTSISHFLEHWNEIQDKTYLQQANVSGCMSASTVHRSKGLEYPVVVMPRFIRRRMSNVTALYKTNYKDLPLVSLSGNLKETTLQEEYVNELFNIEIDSINTLYVACTRPREELYIFDKCTSRDSTALKVFDAILKDFPDAAIENYSFRYGTSAASKPSKIQAVQYFNSYPITCVADGEEPNTKLLPDRNSKDFVEKLNIAETEREHGLLMHKILEHITTGDDIARYVNQYCPPELYSQEEKNSIAEKLQIKLRDERVAHWFDASWDSVLTEQPLLLQGGVEKRPDRMLIKGNEVTIIDYKFTKEKPTSHKQQVREYINILSLMGYTAKGYIWYVDLDEIVDVA